MAPDAMRFAGGPLDGLVYPAPEWPPPEEIDFNLVLLACAHLGREVAEEGHYKRVSYSPLPDSVRESPHLFRGGQYEWVSV
ncbi:MAG TPA: hypothetical protein VFI41_05100 [Gemmatimonadales bacterium]|nr:hypothetical protein [Gemmatimonadales bacterium]